MPHTTETWQAQVNGQIYEANFDELTEWIAEGALLPQDKVRRGELRWLEAGKIPALHRFFNAKRLGIPPPPTVTTTYAETVETAQNVMPGSTVGQEDAAAENPFATPARQNPFLNQTSIQNDQQSTSNYTNAGNADYPHPAHNQPAGFVAGEKIVADEVRSGANWFYWIAGLSLINSVIMWLGGEWTFICGLAITQIFDGLTEGLAQGSGLGIFRVFGVGLDIAAASVFVIIGRFAGRGARWAFVVGFVIYLLDALLYLLFGSLLAVGFHALALFSIYRGFSHAD